MRDTMIGVDLAKNLSQLHGATMTGRLKFRKKLTRSRFRQFMASQPSAVVVMEACGSASHWAREMVKLGHEVKLIAPQYVRPFVKRQKTMLRTLKQSSSLHSAPKCGLSSLNRKISRLALYCSDPGRACCVSAPKL